MSVGYRAVGWNRQKRIYDLVLAGSVVLYLGVFLALGAAMNPQATAETLLIRGFGTAAFVLLHIVLSIGPLCRLDPRFLPLLYNRRHLGVTMVLCALVHGVLSLVQFHALGELNPLVSLFVSGSSYDSLAWFPFQPLGFAALVVLFLMAATSHDFWLANLGAPAWKALHMLVYVAYALLIGHVGLGILQAETSLVLAGLVWAGLTWVCGLHLVAGWREARLDREEVSGERAGPVDVCGVDDIEEGCAHIVTLGGERVAIFRYDGKVSAVSNLCRHQNGPLGEGRIIDGCITCPWHGYQYEPENGTSPPPFTEKVATYDVRVQGASAAPQPTASATASAAIHRLTAAAARPPAARPRPGETSGRRRCAGRPAASLPCRRR